MVDLALLQSISYMAGALGVCIAAVFYVLNLRNSIDNRKAQLLMEYNKIMSSKEWLIDIHESMNYEWKDFDDFWAKYGHASPEAHSKWISIANSLDGAVSLLKWNLVNEEMLRGYLSYTSMGAFWEKFGPLIKEIRKKDNNPHICENQEHLYDLLKQKHPDKLVFR